MVDGGEARVDHRLASPDRERAFDQVQPRSRCRREVQMPAGAFGVSEALAHRFRLVRRKVVQHDVDVEVGFDVEIERDCPWFG